MNKNKHLVLDERYAIQHGLNNHLSFKAIGSSIGKDCTTISKEVRSHLIIEQKGAPYKHFNDCIHRKNCSRYGDCCPSCERHKSRNKCSVCGNCFRHCSDYVKDICPLLLKPPYVCNGCSNLNNCTLEKRYYKAMYAQREYEAVRSESRSGFNLTESELRQLDDVISPLIMNGQSLHHILAHNADRISCCERTAYIYINSGLFSARNIDMPRTVRFKPRKQKSVTLKVDKACRVGRSYEDFQVFHSTHPSLPVTELDSVEGIKGGSVLLTIHFVLPRLQLAFLREANTSKSVTDIFNQLHSVLGDANYQKLFPLCLADNGSEFSNPLAIEYDLEGNFRTNVFYCDPQAPGQKGSCENNHEFIRRVIPKGTDLDNYTQEQISLMMNHINSYGRPELGDKSPYEMFEFYYGKEILDLLGISKVPANEIILKPSLLSKH